MQAIVASSELHGFLHADARAIGTFSGREQPSCRLSLQASLPHSLALAQPCRAVWFCSFGQELSRSLDIQGFQGFLLHTVSFLAHRPVSGTVIVNDQ